MHGISWNWVGKAYPSRRCNDGLSSRPADRWPPAGAGTGIVAITLAILRSTLDLSDQPGSLVTTDLRAYSPATTRIRSHPTAPLVSAIPILQENITSNHPLMSQCTPQAVVLDWEHDALPLHVQDQLEAGLDVIVYVEFFVMLV